MRVDSNRGRKLFELTESRVAHLNACAAQGLSMNEASKELGADPKTIKKAAERAGLTAWLRAKFPASTGGRKQQRRAEYQVITLAELRAEPPQVDTSLPHVRAAMMRWRNAA